MEVTVDKDPTPRAGDLLAKAREQEVQEAREQEIGVQGIRDQEIQDQEIQKTGESSAHLEPSRGFFHFKDFDLCPELRESLERLRFIQCTPIQSEAIPRILQGQDVAGLAQTGTGKTAAFVLPIMERIMRSRRDTHSSPEDSPGKIQSKAFENWRARNFILILVPTRELAEQVENHVSQLSGQSGIRSVSIYGGVPYEKQKKGLKEGVEFVVATPGRLIDLYKEHLVDLKQVRTIVFDEADRMFDMGFQDDMKFILQRVPRQRQFLLFSATLNFEVMNTAYSFGANPVEINISRDEARAENVVDEIFHLGDGEKPQYLLAILKKYKPQQVIVFSNYKIKVERIARFLQINSFPARGISSMLSQAQRNRVIEQFKQRGEQNILVATDVAARGLDIQGVDMVINYELPEDSENYVHRIGRTGRAGASGLAFSLTSDRDVESLARIENYLGSQLKVAWMEDEFLGEEFQPMPRDGRPPRQTLMDREARRAFQKKSRQRSSQGKCNSKTSRPGKKRSHSSVEGEGEGPWMHRDRRSGRHKSKDPKASEARGSSGPQKSKASKGTNRGTKGPSSKKKWPKKKGANTKSTPQHPSTSPPQAQSFRTKLKGLFKKIFR